MAKPIICLDFDGVIHSYTSGWKGEADIPDPPVAGFKDWAEHAKDHFDLVVYSSRSKYMHGIEAMKEWMQDFGIDPDIFIFSAEKPAAFLTIDDRALTFNGYWSGYHPDKLKKFKPWNK